ncbi:flagellar hook-associated protein FlgK [Coprothermobacteraceae bacterium]|nr:flagellar hook-associated protein FlgK [Coprothermobacteraceae bacterium]
MIWSLEIAKRSLQAQMMAINVTSHNIANVNTPGYSRQEAVLRTTLPYSVVSWLGANYPGQVGTGVEVSSIRRLRNEFVDLTYRNMNSKYAYYASKDQIYGILESSINELSGTGLQKALSNFFEAWQAGSLNPEDPTVRQMIVQQSQNLLDAFKYVQQQLVSTRHDADFQVAALVGKINDIGYQISQLNQQISLALSQKQQPNDLMDQRDKLLDELSQYVNVDKVDLPSGSVSVFIKGLSFVDDREVHYIKAIDNDKISAVGDTYEYVEGDRTYAVLPGLLSDGKWNGTISLGTADPFNGHVATLWISMGDTLVPLDGAHLNSGKLAGLVEMRDNILTYGSDPGTGLLMRTNEMAKFFFSKINAILRQGKDLLGNTYVSDFFYVDADVSRVIANLNLDQAVVNDPRKVPLGKTGAAGDGSLALLIAQQQNTALDAGDAAQGVPDYLKGQSLPQAWRTLVSQWAADIGRNRDLTQSTGNVMKELELLRSSESGVSLDEEAMNLIRFQKAYAMTARIVTVVDEMLDRIINMGIVGR